MAYEQQLVYDNVDDNAVVTVNNGSMVLGLRWWWQWQWWRWQMVYQHVGLSQVLWYSKHASTNSIVMIVKKKMFYK